MHVSSVALLGKSSLSGIPVFEAAASVYSSRPPLLSVFLAIGRRRHTRPVRKTRTLSPSRRESVSKKDPLD